MRSAPSTPITLGRFRIRRRIGAGGMGVVYEVADTRTRQRLALKTLERMSPSGLYRLKQEFRSVADVTHPNLVALHELVSAEGVWFFTMELVDGVSFLGHVGAEDPSARATNIPRLRRALLQLASAVNALHRARKLHRDIKPANLLVGHGERVVVLDFGLASDAREDRDELDVEGTPGYMAPEQAAGDPASPASDWYAVGGVLYQALTGRLPFGGSAADVLQAKLQREAPPPSSIVPDVPADLDALCVALLRLRASERPSGAEILLRLQGGTSKKAYPSGEWAAARRVQSEPPSTSGPSMLLGRGASMVTLLEALAAVGPGAPVCVHVRGGPGVGKTALVQHFVRTIPARGLAPPSRPRPTGQSSSWSVGGDQTASPPWQPAPPARDIPQPETTGPDSGESLGGPETVRCPRRSVWMPPAPRPAAVVLSCRCHERESVPYKVLDSLIDALTRHLRSLPSAACAPLLPEGIEELAVLFPVLERVDAIADAVVRIPPASEPGATPQGAVAQALHRRAFGALKALLRDLAAAAPLILAIDDLQWGDRESARLLRELLSPPDPPGLLLIVAYRSNALDAALTGSAAGGVSGGSVPELLKHPPCTTRTVEVEPLAPEEARRMALVRLGRSGAAAEAWAARIASESDGSPFLMEEIIRYAQNVSPRGPGLVAPTLDQVLGARIAALPADARRLLEVVVAAGGPVPRYAALDAARVGAGAARAIHVLCVGGLLWSGGVRDEDAIDTYHARIRERMLATLPPAALTGYRRALLRARRDATPRHALRPLG